jgi:hypothetical protein
MRTRKIRGHKRIWKQIDYWIEDNKTLDLNQLSNRQRDYTKIRIYPWNGFSRTNSKTPEPKRETKKRLLQGLFEIYDSWKSVLDKTGQPYYLKIWLFEPRFSKSQVACAFGDCLDFYENMFYRPDKLEEFGNLNYSILKGNLQKFSWEYRLDEEHFDESQVGSPEDFGSIEDYLENKKWFERMKKSQHRTTKLKQPIENVAEFYSVKMGNVWLGEK